MEDWNEGVALTVASPDYQKTEYSSESWVADNRKHRHLSRIKKRF